MVFIIFVVNIGIKSVASLYPLDPLSRALIRNNQLKGDIPPLSENESVAILPTVR